MEDLMAYSGFWICFGLIEDLLKKSHPVATKVTQELREKFEEVKHGDMAALNKIISEIERK